MGEHDNPDYESDELDDVLTVDVEYVPSDIEDDIAFDSRLVQKIKISDKLKNKILGYDIKTFIKKKIRRE